MCDVYGEACFSKNMFQECQNSIQHEDRPGSLTMLNTSKHLADRVIIKTFLSKWEFLWVQKIVQDDLAFSKVSCH